MIYILEFQPQFHHARYYVGWCEDGNLMNRVTQHRKGQGASITKAAIERGITLKLVTAFPGNRHLERRIKRMKNTPRIVRRIKQKGWKAWPGSSSSSLQSNEGQQIWLP